MIGTIIRMNEGSVLTEGRGEALVKTETSSEVVSLGWFATCLPEWLPYGFDERLNEYKKGLYPYPPIVVGDKVRFVDIGGTLTVTEILFKPNDPRAS